MKRIGVLTFHNAVNYGAVLQAYALQQTLEALGAQCECINYVCNAVEQREHPKWCSQKGMKERLKFLLQYSSAKKREKKFAEFLKNYVKVSSTRYDSKNIASAKDCYDLFLVGSDQVWNLMLTGYDYTYYLDFLEDDSKKFAYAASFGYRRVPEETVEKSGELLKRFSALSAREKSGQTIVQSLTGRTVPMVADPVLLLDAKKWMNLIQGEPPVHSYILVYFTNKRKETMEFARRLAQMTKKKIVYLNTLPLAEPGMMNVRCASPQEFLRWIRYASYVVTGSFHGTAFSILFNRDFYFEMSASDNTYGSRIENLVRLLGLENRRISANNVNPEHIEYEAVNRRLENLKQQSLCYLRENIL
jgi:hypothetical protein